MMLSTVSSKPPAAAFALAGGRGAGQSEPYVATSASGGEPGRGTDRNVHGKVYNCGEPNIPADRLQFRTAPGFTFSLMEPSVMRLHQPIRARIATIAAAFVTASVSAFGQPVPASGQSGQSSLSQAVQAAARQPDARAGRSRCAASRSTRRSGWRWSRTWASGFSASTRRFRTPASRWRDRAGRRTFRRRCRTGSRRRRRRPTCSSGAQPTHRQRHLRAGASASTRRCPGARNYTRQLEQLAVHDAPICSAASARSSRRT